MGIKLCEPPESVRFCHDTAAFNDEVIFLNQYNFSCSNKRSLIKSAALSNNDGILFCIVKTAGARKVATPRYYDREIGYFRYGKITEPNFVI